MQSPTTKAKTPISKAEIEIKEWISGADAEYIDQAIMAAVQVKPNMVNKTAEISDFDTNSINEQIHREIEKFIVSVNGETKNILKEVMNLPEGDYEFIKKEIAERRKKKLAGGQ